MDMAVFNSLFLLLLWLWGVKSLEREMTIYVEPGRDDCFFQRVKQGEVIDIDYQVINGGLGDLDITFRIIDPNGKILYVDFKKSENNHRIEALIEGDYKFCFDNTFSAYNVKTVFFEIIVEREDGDDNIEFEELDNSHHDQVYELLLQDIRETVGRVQGHVTKVKHLQKTFSTNEARDRYIAEENFSKVNSFSIVQVLVMIAVGVVQVVMVRSLFEDNSKVNRFLRKIENR